MRTHEAHGALEHNKPPAYEIFRPPAEPEGPPRGFSFGRTESAVWGKIANIDTGGWKLEGEYYSDFCEKLSHIEGLSVPDLQVLEMSLREFKGRRADQDTVKSMLYRIESCRTMLESNMIIPDWLGTPDIWSYCVVRDVDIQKMKLASVAFLSCECFSNIVAGRTYQLAFPTGYLKKILHDTGYPAYRAAHPREIMGFHFYALLGRSDRGRVGALMIKATSAQQKRNRALVQERYDKDIPVDGCRLPWGCAECRKGTDQCRLACRKTTKESS